jgi:hypothetical protein
MELSSYFISRRIPGESRTVCGSSVSKPCEKRQLMKCRPRREDNIKMNREEIVHEGVNWVEPVQVRVKLRGESSDFISVEILLNTE